MKVFNTVALVLTVIGGINWGLIGIFDYNLVDSVFGAGSVLAKIIYIVVGITAVWTLATLFMKPMDKE
ncbi:MAG: DUF378 domain-containing protein [Candidatus Saccharibacteria bacterium]